MVNEFVKVDKTIIGLMFWNFIGMLLMCSLDIWSLLQKIMQYKLVFFIVTMCKC